MKKHIILLTCFYLLFVLICGAQQPRLILPVGHTSDVYTATFSKDGKYIVTASQDATIKIWQTAGMRLLRTLIGHSTAVTSARFSNDGTKIFSNCYDNTVKIWDFNTGQAIHTYRPKVDFQGDAVISPDGKQAIRAEDDMNAVYDFQKKKVLFSVPGEFRIYTADSKYILTTSSDSLISWNAATGKMMYSLKLHTKSDEDLYVFPVPVSNQVLVFGTENNSHRLRLFSPVTGELLKEKFTERAYRNYTYNSKDFVFASDDGKISIYDFSTLEKKKEYTLQTDSIIDIAISDDSKELFVTGPETIHSYELSSGKFINKVNGDFKFFTYDADSKSGASILAYSKDDFSLKLITPSKANISEALAKGTSSISSGAYQPNGKLVVLSSINETLTIFDLENGQTKYTIPNAGPVNYIEFAPNGKYFITAFFNNTGDQAIRIWDPETGKLLHKIAAHSEFLTVVQISHDSRYIASGSGDPYMRVWDAATGALEFEAKVGTETDYTNSLTITNDNKYVLAQSLRSVILVNLEAKKVVYKIDESSIQNSTDEDSQLQSAAMSPDQKHFTVVNSDGNIGIFETSSGKLFKLLKAPVNDCVNAVLQFNPQGDRMMITWPRSNSISVYETTNWKLLHTNIKHNAYIDNSRFSPDGKTVLSGARDQVVKLWDTDSGTEKFSLPGHDAFISSVFFGENDKQIFSCTRNGEMKYWDLNSGKRVFTYIPLSGNDHLVVDSANRYDGTAAARKLLYFTCGKEIIELDQVKDKLWVPNLAERILHKEPINAVGLNEINICGLTPEVEHRETGSSYYFNIIPRRGGLGETVIYVNGIEAGRFNSNQLQKKGKAYELKIDKNTLMPYMIPGQDNPVTVRAFTSDNTISSRGIIARSDKKTEATTPPSLYAVIVGVSDYKGSELDLKYAAKDATDISAAISNAAKEFLNKDSVEHVFIYNFTTAKDHYQLPEKKSIKNTLREIGKKAKANDILLLFFAGHGVMDDKTKQFYFLTADASRLSVGGSFSDVGISTSELSEWMKPQNIRAQKRILIFDACNSGQAIKDFVKMGNNKQDYMAARNDGEARQIKAIDKLNEKSGLFILSASASNQNAYEMGRYSQGLLTYSLLKAMKQDPGILEDGIYLNVSRWFSAAEKTVSELSRESGARQDPQIISNSNFNIGIINEAVLSKIVLPNEKAIFQASNFQNNDRAVADDDLELSTLINYQLNDFSTRGSESSIIYNSVSNASDAYKLSGGYDVVGNIITVKVNLKQNKDIKLRFEVTGQKDKLDELVKDIAKKASEIAK